MSKTISDNGFTLVDKYGFPVKVGDLLSSTTGFIRPVTGGIAPIVKHGVGSITINNRSELPSHYNVSWIKSDKVKHA